jgi:hypothetical protein
MTVVVDSFNRVVGAWLSAEMTKKLSERAEAKKNSATAVVFVSDVLSPRAPFFGCVKGSIFR